MNDYSFTLIKVMQLARDYQQALVKHQTQEALDLADQLCVMAGKLYDWTENQYLEEKKRV
jgi:ABC-type proline/glycine betaine transport system ATPase subunit